MSYAKYTELVVSNKERVGGLMRLCRRLSSICLIFALTLTNFSVAAAITEVKPVSSFDDYYFVEMKEEPIVSYTGGIKGLESTKVVGNQKLNPNNLRVKKYRDFLRKKKSSLAKWLSDNTDSVSVEGEYTTTLNALAVKASPKEIKKLASAPGVKKITRSKFYRPLMSRSNKIINTPPAWSSGFDGTGIKVGVIDSGIDVNHPFLKDPTLKMPEGFPKTDKFEWQKYTSNKVIVAKVFYPYSKATPKALDSHGTHVAGIIAGRAGYIDPQNTVMGSLSGVAPNAYLGNYNVFPCKDSDAKCKTSSIAIAAAIEAAVNDGMNVINLSLGSTADDGPDILVDAVNAATKAGVTVTVAAGNEGPERKTIGSPGIADSVITVGSVNNDQVVSKAIDVTVDGTTKVVKVEEAAGGGAMKNLSAPAEILSDKEILACKPLETDLTGKIAVIKRGGGCEFTKKATNVMKAGAVGAIVVNNTSGNLFKMGISKSVKIPVVLVTDVDGRWILKGSSLSMTMKPDKVATFTSKDSERVSSFSSRGPTVFNKLKPDVVAVGGNVCSSVLDKKLDAYSGTSMAAPQVAGAAAILLQAHPDWEPKDIKAALMGTARNVKGKAKPTDVGAGIIDISKALEPAAMSYPSSLNFGSLTKKKKSSNVKVVLKNSSNKTRDYEIKNAESSNGVKVDQTNFTLKPGEKITLQFSTIPSLRAAGIYQGYIYVDSDSGGIRLPYLYRRT